MSVKQPLKIIVKVGISSNISFRNVRAYRALTFNDVRSLIALDNEIDNIVIEGIQESEREEAIEIIEKLKKDNKNIFIYTKNDSDYAVELSKNTGIERINSMDELHHKIEDITGEKVGIKWHRIETVEREEHKKELEEALSVIDDSVRFAEDIELPAIENKEDLEELGEIIHDIESLEEENKQGDSLESYKEKTTSEIANLLTTVTIEKQAVEEQLRQAMNRITILLDIKEAIEDERDMYKNMITELDNNSDIIEDPVSSEEVQNIENELNKYKDKCMQAEDKIIQLEEQLSLNKEEVEAYNVQLDSLNSQLREATDKINEYKLKEEEYENTISKLSTELIESQGTSSAEDIIKLAEINEELSEANVAISRLEDRVTIESRQRLKLTELAADVIEESKAFKIAINAKNIEIEELRASVKILEDSIAITNSEFQQLKNNYDYLSNSQNEINQKRDNEKQQLQMQMELAVEKTNYFERELSRVKGILEEKEEKLAKALADTSYKDKEKLLESNRVVEEANKALLSNINLLKNELDELKEKLRISNMSIETLEENNKQLKSSVLDLSRGASGGVGKITLDCDYTGKAFIIPVYGSGSYGVTTTAMSIIRKLPSGNVLYMDMDMTNPKADGWFGKTAIIRDLPGIKDVMLRTGFGSLVEKGIDYVIQNEKVLFQRVLDTKTGSIDYFSGMYTRVNITKLLSISFTEFMNYVGNCYNYIVVDLGRLGSSDISDALIKMFDDIAYRSVVVTLKDKTDVRNLAVKASQEKLRFDNMIWVLNMSDDTKVDPIIIKSINSAKMLIMPKAMKMYGTNQSYDKVQELKDKFAELMDLILK